MLAGLVAALFAFDARADRIWAWDSLHPRPDRRDGLFAVWGADQQKVLAALRSAERAGRSSATDALESRVREHPDDLPARDLLGLTYLRRGRISDAIAQFHAVLAADPTFRSSRLNLAELFLEANRPDLAERELKEIIRLDPDARYARKRLATLYTQLGHHDEAAKVLGELARLEPTDAGTQLALAAALLHGRQVAAAKAPLDAAIRLSPNAPAASLLLAEYHRARGDWAAARKELEDLRKREPESDAGEQLAILLLHQREYQAARDLLQQGIDAPSARSPMLTAFVVAAQGCGSYEAAAECCRRLRVRGQVYLAGFLLADLWLARGDAAAVRATCAGLPRASSDLGTAYDELLAAMQERPDARKQLALQLNLTRLFQQAGWADQAVEAAEAAIGLAPRGNILVSELLANCYRTAGRRVDELRQLDGLARARPGSRTVALTLARVYAERGDLARAAETCERSLASAPDDLEALQLMGDLALRRGDCSAAAEVCCKALLKYPRDDGLLRMLVRALLPMERFADAAGAIRARQGADPAFAPEPLDRALLALADGEADAALKHCEVGLHHLPLDPHLRFLAGILLERQGDPRSAIPHFEVTRLVERRYTTVHLHLARSAAQAGRTALALDAYRSAATLEPSRVEVQLEFADALSRAGRSGDAIDQLRSLAPKQDADRRDVQARLAEEYLVLGDAPRALAFAEPVLAEDPKHARARRVAIEAHRRLGNIEGAARLYERLLAAAPGADVDAELGILRFLQQRNDEAGERLARAAKAREGAGAGDLPKWLAAATLARGAKEEALTLARQAVGSRPQGAPGSVALAVILAAAGSSSEAELETARLKGGNAETSQWLKLALPRFAKEKGLAGAYLASLAASAHGWHGVAVKMLETAHEHAQGEPLVLHALAMARRDAGMLNGALESLRELERLRPKSGTVQLLLGQALDAQRQPGTAVAAYQRAASLLDKQDGAAWLILAQRFSLAGKADEAIEAYRVVLAAEPEDAAACNNLAWLYACHKPSQLAEAERLASLAAKRAPETAPYRDTLGWVLFLRKKHAEASRELEAAVALSPGKATYHYHLGMVRFGQGEWELARQALRRALAMDPNLPDAETARATLKLIEAESRPAQAEPRPAPDAPRQSP